MNNLFLNDEWQQSERALIEARAWIEACEAYAIGPGDYQIVVVDNKEEKI